ncbi:(2Fe-2S) ferredoxin domain-containing protein [Spirochaeta cellobiosiphila]|uniref:(2Fe-2S) ferredoxin domain-containing protein n=1 Tax=Spirochaeta cellobiosiphila TaxID=504483 RepID=UPI00040B530C|nr:(2Fe-2S) ferredoxin domain-containing protein [Spirochaeta cellobiosiphila]
MEKPDRHILVCASFRAAGTPQGVCHKKGAFNFVQYLETELMDRDELGTVMVSTTGCLKVCDRGPAMVIYPEGKWYGGFESEDDIDEILDALEEGEGADQFLLAE